MRLSYRVGSAALLILAFILIKHHLDLLQDESLLQPLWQFTNIPEQDIAEPAVPPTSPQEVMYATPTAGKEPSTPTFETMPIVVPNDRVIVMAKLSREDTAWVGIDLGEWRNFIYTVDDPNAPRRTPKNKGRESLAYLQYIVDHYHDLPSMIVFLHSHKYGWPGGWHTDTMGNSNVDAIRSLQTGFVLKNGYVNLRCQEVPGCPDEIRPLDNPPRPERPNERAYAQAWIELFNNTDIPEVIGAPCCSQFAVSRDQVLKRPLSEYQRYHDWVLNTDLPDAITSWVMEYSWHIIFGKDPVFCPSAFQCYEDVYGNAFF